MTVLPLVACYGGTFDPVHNGHLQAASEVCRKAQCREVRLIPCRVPPHRAQPCASPAQRRAMLALASAGCEGLAVDGRELARDGPSYTVDTLRSLREELGDQVALGWVLGADAFAGLDSWRDWQRLPELAHLLLLDRPGFSVPKSGAVAEMLQARLTDAVSDLHAEAAGRIWYVRQTPLAVSATVVRETLAAQRSAAHLLPNPVWAYIKQQRLYGYDGIEGDDAESE